MSEPQPPEMMEVFGVKPDGTQVSLGMHPIHPIFKMKDIVRTYFGDPDDETKEDAGMALACLQEFYEWYKQQPK